MYKRQDALYDYDFGTVRDAAKQLGIGNVDKKSESKTSLTTSKADLKPQRKSQLNSQNRIHPKSHPFLNLTLEPLGNPQQINRNTMTHV